MDKVGQSYFRPPDTLPRLGYRDPHGLSLFGSFDFHSLAREGSIDHGYAVTSHSSQGTTVDRVLINADTSESRVLLNDRMGYVAVSRAREDAIIYTNSIEELRGALDRRVDKEMAVEALRESEQHRHELKGDQGAYDGEIRESLEMDRGYEQDLMNETNNRATEAIEIEEMEFELA